MTQVNHGFQLTCYARWIFGFCGDLMFFLFQGYNFIITGNRNQTSLCATLTHHFWMENWILRNIKKIISTTLRVLLFSVLFTHMSCCTNGNSDKKYNPGHYVALRANEQVRDINYLDEPSVQGVNKRYHWRHLEPEKSSLSSIHPIK